MNEEQWVTCLNELMDRQMNAAKRNGVIFTIALSRSQVRVFVEAHGQKCQQYFIYHQASEAVAKKVIQKTRQLPQLTLQFGNVGEIK